MTRKLTPEEFLALHLTEGKSYQYIADKYKEDRKTLSKWWADNLEIRNLIKKSNQIFNNKKNRDDFTKFQKLGKRGFFEWYKRQPRHCHYCGTKEEHLQELFNTQTLSSKRKRGPSLELERRDSDRNEYSPENCVLACYFCNNHKSDVISEDDHKTYFATAIGEYLAHKYKNLKKK